MRAITIVWCVTTLGSMFLTVAPAKAKEPPDNSLVIGDGYTLRVERNGVNKQFRGDLVKLNARWIVLRRTSVLAVARPIPMLSTLPVVGGVFYTSIPERHDDLLWIPREAATVEKRVQPKKPSNIHPPDGDDPPAKVACAVEAAVGKKAILREGGMQEVYDDKLVVAVTTTLPYEMPTNAVAALVSAGGSKRPKERYTREQFARKDVLCVRVPTSDMEGVEPHVH